MDDSYLNLYGGPLSNSGGEATIMDINDLDMITRPIVFLYRIKEGGFLWVSPNYTDPYGPGFPDDKTIYEDIKIINEENGRKIFHFISDNNNVYLTDPDEPAVIKSLANFAEYLKKQGRPLEEEREEQRKLRSFPGERTLI